jgi:tripartite-type tricarboxylate transporter receptor subunit TctC
MLRRRFVATAGATLAAPALVSSASADTWPSRQIKVVIPYPPGGPTDISARIVMEKVGQLLGQPVLFDNKGGASGMIGAAYARTQPADGYNLLATTVAMLAITRHLQPIPFDPDRDFIPVARMATSWACLSIHPSVPATTMAEFVAYARANPGKINYGSSGNATITHLNCEILNLEAGIKMTHVPYKGSAQATQDLLGGQIQAQTDQTTLPHVLAGRLRGLAIVGDLRWPYKPDIPTMKETGYGKDVGESWYGMLAPAGTPAEIVDRLSRTIGEAINSADVLDKLDKGGAKPTYLNSADMHATLVRESALYADIIKRGDIKL